MIWFNAGGKGGGGQPGSFTAVQPAAICNFTAHSIHMYALHSYMIIWGCEMLNCRFFFLLKSAQQLPYMLQLWPMQMQQTYSLASAGRLQTLWTCMQCKYMEAKQAKTNSDSSRNEELERMLCWWLFLHHHAHTYPSVKGNELSPCKISSQSLFTHRDEQKHCVKSTRMMLYILNSQ